MFPTPQRIDLSPTLIHLTGDRDGRSARDALISILSEMRVRASGYEGFVKGRTSAVCFTEAPFTLVPDIIRHRRNGPRPYGAFGIMVQKIDAWHLGARPVLYLPDNEGTWIPEDQKWRQVRFEMPHIDFTHEREWRLPGDLDLSQLRFSVILQNDYHATIVSRTLHSLPHFDEIEPHLKNVQLVYAD